MLDIGRVEAGTYVTKIVTCCQNESQSRSISTGQVDEKDIES